MSVTVETVTIGGVVDQRLALSNGQWAGKMTMGSNWTKLRVGMRCCVDNYGAHMTWTPRLYFGIMSTPAANLTNGPLGATTNHFLGIRTNSVNWIYHGTPQLYFYHATNDCYCKKVGSGITTATGVSVNQYTSIVPASNRNAWVVEFEKISSILTSITIVICSASNNNTGEVSTANFLTAFGLPTMVAVDSHLDAVSGTTYTGSAGVPTIATDEAADGYWDSICVGWDQASPVAHISDMMFSKLA